MARTDRLYAVVDVLRANAPSGVTVRSLAERFEVSTRTIERDVVALQNAGVPIWTETGRRGGVHIDPTFTLPPLNLTADEAFAIALALARDVGSPFSASARRALTKVAAILPAADAEGVRDLVARARIIRSGDGDGTGAPAGPSGTTTAIGEALARRRVLTIDYVDAEGVASTREVEPMGLVVDGAQWYLVAWCRLRGAERAFRTDRVGAATVSDEPVALRPFEVGDETLRALAEQVDWP